MRKFFLKKGKTNAQNGRGEKVMVISGRDIVDNRSRTTMIGQKKERKKEGEKLNTKIILILP